jgi:hypothetical protein
MPSISTTLIVLALAVMGGFYQINVHPVVRVSGVLEPSKVPSFGTRDCLKVEELSTCESEYQRLCIPAACMIAGGLLTF